MTRGWLVHSSREQLSTEVRAVCNWAYGSAGVYWRDFGCMVALRWSGRLNLEVQFGWFQLALSLGPIPDRETIALLIPGFNERGDDGRQVWNIVDE